MSQLGANALGEVLEPGRVPDCYLGLRLDPAGDAQAAGVLVVAPTALLHPAVPQPDGTVLYELLTGHPDRMPAQLVFLADLTVELGAWPTDTWTKVGIDPQAAAGAVVAGWRAGQSKGLRREGLTTEEALALDRAGTGWGGACRWKPHRGTRAPVSLAGILSAVRFSEIASRMTGISTPIFSVSRTPPTSEWRSCAG